MPEGLEWMLELDAKLEGALGMVRALEKADGALRDVDAGLRKTERASERASEGHKKHGHEVEKVDHSLRHLIVRIGEFEAIRWGFDKIVEAPGELIEKIREIGEEILTAGATAERTEAAFKNLFGDEDGKEQIEIIDQIGQHTEFTRGQLKDMTLDLAQAGGFQGEALLRARAAVTDIASFSKNAEEGASRAASALGRINLSGHVDARSLRGVGVSEKTYFGALSERTGKDAKTLKKAMEAGKLDTTDALEALYTVITRKTKKLLGGAGSDMEKLLSARLKHVKELPDLIYESVKNTRGFSEISDFLGEIAEKFSPESEFGIAAKQGIASVFGEIGDQLKGVDLGQVAKSLSGAMLEISGDIQPAMAAFKALGEMALFAAKGVGKVIDIAHDYTPIGFLADKLVDPMIAKMAAEGGGEGPAASRMPTGAFDRAKARDAQRHLGAPKAAFSIIPKQFRFDEKPMAEMGDNAGVAFSKNLNEAMTYGGKEGSAGAVGAAREELQIKSPSRVFEDLGEMSGEGFSAGIQRAGVQAAVADVVSPRGGGAGGAAGAGIHFEFNVGGIHIVSSAAAGADIPQQVVDRIAQMLPGMVHGAFEQMASQAGSA